MTIYSQIVNVLCSTISLMLLWWLVFISYRQYRLERFRDDMFALRNELFDDAASGKIGFDHPAYDLLRSTMNGFIRYAHRMSLISAIFIIRTAAKRPAQLKADRFDERFSLAISDLEPAQRVAMYRYYERMNMLFVEHVILYSPEFCIVAVPLMTIDAISFVRWRIRYNPARVAKRIVYKHPRRIAEIDGAALAYAV